MHRHTRPVLGIATHMDEYQTRLLVAVSRTLAEYGVPLVVHCDGPLDLGARSPMLVGLLRESPPVGVVKLNARSETDEMALQRLLDEADVPVVHIGMRRSGAVCVYGDNVGGMQPLMAHLLDERGARRPALLRGIPHHPDSMDRERVFRSELARRGIPVDEELVVTGSFEKETAYDAMRELLSRRRDLDAVVALNDMSALSAIAALQAAGLRVPEDVAVTGFDNELIARQWPGLTTVDQDFEQQGAVAASMLMEQIVERRTAGDVVVPSRLIVRGSTAPPGHPPVTDPIEFEAMAVADKEQLAAQDASLTLSDALNACWTIEQVVDVVVDDLHRLGIVRCFLALHDSYPGRRQAGGTASAVNTDEARLILAYTGGEESRCPTTSFASRELLPAEFARELEDGMLVLQPLAVLGRPIGFLLFEQTSGSARVTALMRTEISRAIYAVVTTQEMQARADRLEEVVDRRTRELQAEIVTRQRAERELRRANVELQRYAMLDGLTQLANRTAFDRHLDEHWNDHAQRGSEMALLMIDVDSFKLYNDHYGHLAGDEALRTIADCLRRAVGAAHDLAARYGGEEFIVMLADTGEAGACTVADRFRRMLAGEAIAHAAAPSRGVLTASIGVAAGVPEGADPQTMIEAADRALYQAKVQGRDRVVVSGRTEVAAPSASLVATGIGDH